MKQYLDLIRNVLDTGTIQENRTGVRTISIPGAMMRFDLADGFPAITTKRLAFKTAIGEMVGFLRAYKSAADFRALGSKVWDQNANENKQWLENPYRMGHDDLGEIYGVQWRQWPAYKVLQATNTAQINDAQQRGFKIITQFTENGIEQVLLYKAVDQLRQCLDTIISNPSDRRIIFHGWNWAHAYPILWKRIWRRLGLFRLALPRSTSRPVGIEGQFFGGCQRRWHQEIMQGCDDVRERQIIHRQCVFT